jgi:hypothetical protein
LARTGTHPVTLGDLAAEGRGVWVWCNRCTRSARLAAGDLAARLGRECPVPQVGRRLRCTACGGRDAETRPDWPRGGVVASHRWHED